MLKRIAKTILILLLLQPIQAKQTLAKLVIQTVIPINALEKVWDAQSANAKLALDLTQQLLNAFHAKIQIAQLAQLIIKNVLFVNLDTV